MLQKRQELELDNRILQSLQVSPEKSCPASPQKISRQDRTDKKEREVIIFNTINSLVENQGSDE